MNGRTFLSVVLGLVVAASMVVGGAGSAVATSSTDRTAVEGGQYLQDGAANQTGDGLNLSRLNVTAFEAAVIAQNETGGKVLAVRLKRVNGTPGYEVLVANEAGNVTGVVVNAEQAELIETRENLARLNVTAMEQLGVNVSDIAGAVETIQMARQEVGDEFVPIEVSIEAEPGFLGQQITFISPNATKAVVVDLTNNSVVAVSEAVPKRGAEGMNATTTANESALQDASGMSAVQDGDNETNPQDCCVGDDELTREFGDASEFVAVQAGDFDENFFAADDEFDTADEFGAFTGVEEEEDEGLFDGEGEEEEEAEGFLGEEDEDGWF